MRSTTISATAALLSALTLVNGQTFTSCNPTTNSSCPADPGLGTTVTTDFTKGPGAGWVLEDGTSMSYGSQGAQFVISKSTDAPTIYYDKYIMFGKVTVTLKASPGDGTVSSFILESDDLDEIDWEWLGTSDVNVESNFFGKGNTTTYDRALYHPVTDPIGTFSTYTIDWTAASTNWYINGALVRTLNYGDPLAVYGQNYPQTPMRVKMGNWVGCVDAAAMANTATQGTCQWAMGTSTSYIDWNSNPSFTMYVQSVTIQDYGNGGNYVYTDESGSWQSIKSEGSSGNSNSGGSSSSSASTGTGSKTSTSSSTSTGGILIETSTSTSSSTSTNATTMTTATGSSTGSKTTSSSASTTSKPAQSTSSGAETLKPMHKYGVIDVAVIGLGLGMGYLFM
jgi:beta-glucanase (GH16 family)